MSLQYPKVDHCRLDLDGGYYWRHVAAMTDEGLHRKSDIAGQLGDRDRTIDRLRRAAQARRKKMDRLIAVLREVRAERDALAEALASVTE